MRIGFIGLGIMGKPMAKNLLAAGHELVVSTHNRAAADELVNLGAGSAETPREIAEQVDLVITMLPNSPQVTEVVLGSDGVLEGAHGGLVYVDASSIAPRATREIGEALAGRDVPMLDAPVSGGEPKAIDGTLSFMVGGDQAVFDRIRPVLEVMGGSVVRVGDLGAGNVAKLANQVIVAVNLAAVGEALVLARQAGVEPEAVVEAIRGGLAGSAVLEAKAPMMLDHDFTPGFRIDLHIKDLVNALDTSAEVRSPLPLARTVLDFLQGLQADGHGSEDHSGLVQHYEQQAGTSIARPSA